MLVVFYFGHNVSSLFKKDPFTVTNHRKSGQALSSSLNVQDNLASM